MAESNVKPSQYQSLQEKPICQKTTPKLGRWSVDKVFAVKSGAPKSESPCTSQAIACLYIPSVPTTSLGGGDRRIPAAHGTGSPAVRSSKQQETLSQTL